MSLVLNSLQTFVHIKDTAWVAARTSYTPAPESTATVAPFRAWRDLQHIVAGEPARSTIIRQYISSMAPRWDTHCNDAMAVEYL